MATPLVCAESGRYAGLDASDAGNDQQEDIGNTYILHQYGEITCTGVISVSFAFQKFLFIIFNQTS